MENKTVFVTGATRGIGRAIALAFAEKRYDVIANYRNEEAAKSLNEAITAKGVRCLTLKGDVSSPADCDYMFEQIEKEFGHLDVLVNNAGITRDSLTLRMSEEDFKAVTDVNLFGVFNCMKRAFKMMMKKKAGRIISISSISGITGNPGQINYSCESRCYRHDKNSGKRGSITRDNRKRDCARVYRNGYDRRAPGEDCGTHAGVHSAKPLRKDG